MILGEKNLETILKRNKYDWGKIAYDKNFHSRIWRTLFLSEDEGVNQLKDFELPYEDLTLRSMFILILFLLGIFMFLILESPILKGLSTGILILLSGYLLWAGISKKNIEYRRAKMYIRNFKLNSVTIDESRIVQKAISRLMDEELALLNEFMFERKNWIANIGKIFLKILAAVGISTSLSNLGTVLTENLLKNTSLSSELWLLIGLGLIYFSLLLFVILSTIDACTQTRKRQEIEELLPRLLEIEINKRKK
jgi:hypothetical protein